MQERKYIIIVEIGLDDQCRGSSYQEQSTYGEPTKNIQTIKPVHIEPVDVKSSSPVSCEERERRV
jgi:hypothetical protein